MEVSHLFFFGGGDASEPPRCRADLAPHVSDLHRRVSSKCSSSVGRNPYVDLGDACSLNPSYSACFVPVEFRVIPTGDIGASDNSEWTSIVERLATYIGAARWLRQRLCSRHACRGTTWRML